MKLTKKQLKDIIREVIVEVKKTKSKILKNKPTKNKFQKNKFRKPKKIRESGELNPEYETAYEEGANAYFEGVSKEKTHIEKPTTNIR